MDPNLLYGAIHVGNNKQSMTLTLLIFKESTTAVTDCYFPESNNLLFSLSNSLLYAMPKYYTIDKDKETFKASCL